jgi:malonyl-CoA O-methyltransferase
MVRPDDSGICRNRIWCGAVTSNLARKSVAESFDQAAVHYDRAAGVQAQVAERLVQMAAERLPRAPQNLLDIGCGTGFAAAAAGRLWPQSHIAAIDGSPAMLQEARRKMPRLEIKQADIAGFQPNPDFDLILSSLALHWLPDAAAALVRWQKGLRPGGRLFVALLVDGSFREWRELCRSLRAEDGLWRFPSGAFAQQLAARTESDRLSIVYPSARDFVRQLKSIGAATPRADHKPFDAALMRRMLAAAPRPFPVSYCVNYIEMQSPGSI